MGKFSKKFLMLFYFPLIALIFTVLLFTAWTFVDSYSLLDYSISFLGDPADNPNGWVYWAVAMSIMGILLLPLAPYIHRQLEGYNKILQRIGSIFILIAGIGLFFLGVFPQSEANKPIHLTSATMSFSGLYFGAFFLGFIIIQMDSIEKWKKILFCILGWGGPIGFFITQGTQYFSTGYLGDHGPWILHLHAWEWFLFFFIFATIVCMYYIVPEREKNI